MTFSLSGSQRPQWQPSRHVQAGWVLFALFSLSLGAAGVAAYRHLLAIACRGPDCLPGQFAPEAMAKAVPAYFQTVAERSELDGLMAVLIAVSLAGSAAFFIWQRSGQRAFALGGYVLVALAAEPFVGALARAEPQWHWALRLLQMVHLAGLVPFMCLIPDNHIEPGWLRVPVALSILLGLLIPVLGNTQPGLQISYSALAVASAAISIWAKMKQVADERKKEQLIWLAVGVVLLGATQIVTSPLVLLPLPSVPTGSGGLFGAFTLTFLGSTFLWTAASACILISILRREVLDVETILNRTMLYVILSLFVLGANVLVVGYLSLLFQTSTSVVISLFATGLTAVLFQPIRVWAQRFVNQLLYGERDRPYAVLSQLGQQLESAFAPQEILQTVVTTVRSALKLPYAAITLRAGDQEGFEIAAAEGEATGSPLTLPLVVRGHEVGQFILSPRSPQEPFTSTDKRLLGELAGQVGIAAHTAILMMDLQSARENLVLAREEERLRLRRDLHDGLGTTLAALNLQAGHIRRLIPTHPAEADAAVLELRVQLRQMVAEVRRLINDLRPRTLDEFGLAGAVLLLLEGMATANSLRVSLQMPEELPALPAAVEVAAFRIVQEGLTNVVKHAQAHRCLLRLTAGKGLQIGIVDDGIGLPVEVVKGMGLRTIRERVSELGGTCVTENRVRGGACISVWLPLEDKEKWL